MLELTVLHFLTSVYFHSSFRETAESSFTCLFTSIKEKKSLSTPFPPCLLDSFFGTKSIDSLFFFLSREMWLLISIHSHREEWAWLGWNRIDGSWPLSRGVEEVAPLGGWVSGRMFSLTHTTSIITHARANTTLASHEHVSHVLNGQGASFKEKCAESQP